jgi:aspartate racemase
LSAALEGDEQADLVVGVLGGLGPEATHDFFGKVLAATGASRDQEHLHLLIDCNPKLPNRNDAIAGTGPSPAPALAAMAASLERAGAQILVMPCNTATFYAPEISAALAIPLIDIVAETTEEVRQRLAPGDPVGILAAAGCRRARLYETALEAYGLIPIATDEPEQEGFMDLLYVIKAGDRSTAVRAALAGLAERLVDRGAKLIIAGCTEIPLVLNERDLSVPMVDSTDVLAKATVAYAKRQRPLPSA